MNVGLNLVVLRVSDLGRSSEFYRAIGLSFTTERHGDGPEHLVAECRGIVFELYPLLDGSSSAGTRIGFSISSVEVAVENIKAAGGVIHVAPKLTAFGVRAVAIDPDGHRVELSQT